jgi:hypothetical protein
MSKRVTFDVLGFPSSSPLLRPRLVDHPKGRMLITSGMSSFTAAGSVTMKRGVKTARKGASLGAPLRFNLPNQQRYSKTKIFFFAHMSFKIFGQTVTLTSPKWALRSSSIWVRDWPMPPPMLRGSSPLTIP